MPDGPRYPNYPFAIARVRLNGTPGRSTSKNVRVFFRLFVTQTSDTDYDPSSTYPSDPDAAGLPGYPTLGLQQNTVPFFATGNLTANDDFAVQQDYASNSVNNQPIVIGSNGGVWAYYGCFLNIYAPNNLLNGKPIFQHLIGTHNCLVAQIAFDDTPIPVNQNGTTTSPAISDKLAQRNLQITVSDNPGPPSTHRIPQTFDVRPSAALTSTAGQLLDYPDELIIDWGNTPPGATASICWPAVSVSDVLSLARRLYSTNQLSAANASTIQCTVPAGQTYIPIPPSTNAIGENFAGLFTIDLPQGVTQGEEFQITVRRVTTRRMPDLVVPKSVRVPAGMVRRFEASATARGGPRPTIMLNWRYTVGSFAVRIPVATRDVMLRPEMNTLAIMKWRLAGMDRGDRWWPVLSRYVDFISKRVDGLGGNADAVEASPNGTKRNGLGLCEEICGRVVGIVYDCCGCFEGILIRTVDGKMGKSREKRVRVTSRNCDKIEKLVKEVWEKRILVSICVEKGN